MTREVKIEQARHMHHNQDMTLCCNSPHMYLMSSFIWEADRQAQCLCQTLRRRDRRVLGGQHDSRPDLSASGLEAARLEARRQLQVAQQSVHGARLQRQRRQPTWQQQLTGVRHQFPDEF